MIDFKTLVFSPESMPAAPIAVFSYEEGLAPSLLPAAMRKQLGERIRAHRFKGRLSEVCAVFLNQDCAVWPFLVVGLGKKKDADAESARRASGALARYVRARYKSLTVFAADPGPVAEGLGLASYRFEEYKKADEQAEFSEAVFLVDKAGRRRTEAALARIALAVEAVSFARDLVNRAPSDKTPEAMGTIAGGLSGSGVSVKIIDESEARKLGMGSFLSVARGSTVPPRFVHLSYKPKGAKKKIALVGKGITFDSGGLSLKPPQSLEEMKLDMAGAASVLAVFKVIARLKPKCEVHGVCAFTYNMPGPDATKPGDIVKAMNGKTIEILNTDAEGRLILADALTYAERLGVDSMIDIATLTGAVLIALGSSVTGAMTNNEPLLRRLEAASKRAGEPMWQLPLVRSYVDNIKSPIADLRNISKVRGEAGTIIGGLFLQEFVAGKPWVHLDVAGTAWTSRDLDYCAAGGTGQPVRTLLEFVSDVR